MKKNNNISGVRAAPAPPASANPVDVVVIASLSCETISEF